ncbi:MAG: hypothetical protein ABS52_05955 [Gemmatimonadetes bacterium SCN 70-22]|nr:MAG: hypothetical protein ABS52_05955 [Gemmatimonadetes bacterium SCN 70-22]
MGRTAAGRDRAGDFSRFRLPVLMWVAAQRAVTVRQVLFRFWILDGRAGSHGFRVIRQLIAEGLIESAPLYPILGRASVQFLTPTRAGWRELGQPPRGRVVARLEDVLQFSQLCLVREAAGWTIEPPAQAWPLIRRRALDVLRLKPRGDEMAQEARRWVERMRHPMVLGPWCLHHRSNGEVRLIVNVRSLAELARTCNALVPVRLVNEAMPFELELTGANPDQLESVRKQIAKAFAPRTPRAARRAMMGRGLPHLDLVAHATPDFRSLPHPTTAKIPPCSVYEEHRVESPLTLRTAAPWMATRAGGVV